MLDRVNHRRNYLDSDLDDATIQTLRMHSNTGRPLGDESFLDMLENKVGKVLRSLKQGRKRKVGK